MATKKRLNAEVLQAAGGDVRPVRIIKSEQDAVTLAIELSKMKGPLPFQIKFDGWPVLSANLRGDQFKSTITTGVMQGFIALQKELNRSYTAVKFGELRPPKLSQEERDALELEVRVSKGSSDLITINTPKIFDAIANSLTTMTSADTALVLIIGALAYFGQGAIKAWLANKKEVRIRELDKDEHSAARDQTIALSQEHTKQLKIIGDIVRGKPQLEGIVQSANDAHDEMLKSMRSAESVSWQGVEMDGEFVREVTARERRDFQHKTYKKKSRILKVDTSNEAQYRVTIRLLDSGQELTCPLEDETMDTRYKAKILEALSTRAKVTLQIEAKAHGDTLKDVKILGID